MSITPVRCGCWGEAKVAFCQQSYCGQNCFGDKKIKYRVYMICKKCHTRGKPIITDWLINPHPWDSKYSGRIRHNAEQDEMFAPYVERAITAWNRAMSGNVQECAKDARCNERTAKPEWSEEAEPERKWTPCSERLPLWVEHVDDMVLVCYGNGSIRFNTCMNGEWVHGNPIAWMPLPEPWGGE